MSPRVVAVVVSYNNPTDTAECVLSLLAQTVPCDIIVVDNGDEARYSAPAECGRQIQVATPSSNLGFAGGCNLGIELAERDSEVDFFWFINNDAIAVPSALAVLLATTDQYPETDVFGSWIAYADSPGRLWYRQGELNRRTGAARQVGGKQPPQGELCGPATWISGCNMLIRGEAMRRLGGFDQHFFIYKEELEWQLRAQREGGGAAVVVSRPLVKHKVGGSTGSTNGPLGHAFMTRNGWLLARRYGGAWLPFWLIRLSYDGIIRPLRHGRWDLVRAALLGLRYARHEPYRLLRELRPTQ